jgi:hypothetical protein
MAKVLVKLNGAIVFTRDYEAGRFKSNVIKAGTSAIATKTHKGLLGRISHVTVRLKTGEFIKGVPIDCFRAE